LQQKNGMTLEVIGPSLQMPANGSRFFPTLEQSLKQPIGTIQFAWDTLDPYVFNKNFDETLIVYDRHYVTSVADAHTQAELPILSYFDRILIHLSSNPKIIEIGCGKGELVERLIDIGHNAHGFDPVLLKSTRFLTNTLYDPLEHMNQMNDLFILRCVLPHIKNPWVYLNRLFQQNPKSCVLIEYQRIEFMFEHKLWFNLGHGHVNQFTLQDFQKRFILLDYGEFKNSEWQWVLIKFSNSLLPLQEIKCPTSNEISELIEQKNNFLLKAKNAGPLAIYGAAGKGIILAEALVSCGADIICAIDSSRIRFEKYLEVSGVRVVSATTAIEKLSKYTRIIVCNPNHISHVELIFKGVFEISLASEL
jgi:hypothetical protein